MLQINPSNVKIMFSSIRLHIKNMPMEACEQVPTPPIFFTIPIRDAAVHMFITYIQTDCDLLQCFICY